ncbi:MAG: hypothetical protein RJA81_1744, partial [Planctomycetota bacterium]
VRGARNHVNVRVNISGHGAVTCFDRVIWRDASDVVSAIRSETFFEIKLVKPVLIIGQREDLLNGLRAAAVGLRQGGNTCPDLAEARLIFAGLSFDSGIVAVEHGGEIENSLTDFQKVGIQDFRFGSFPHGKNLSKIQDLTGFRKIGWSVPILTIMRGSSDVIQMQIRESLIEIGRNPWKIGLDGFGRLV